MIVAASNDELLGAISALFAIALGLGLALARISNRLARVEEWIRVSERGREDPDEPSTEEGP